MITELKIGVLLPKSSLYPSIAFDIRDGLKARLAMDESCRYQFVFEQIGNGGVPAQVYEKAEKLLLTDDVDIVVAFLDHTAAASLDPLFAEVKRPLIVLDPGAHTPMDWANTHPYRYTLSLQSALNSFVTGKLAAEQGAARTIFGTSFYEGGYLQCNAYQKSFARAGGHVAYHSVVPFRIHEFNTDHWQQAVAQIQPDAVLALFSAESGAFFLDRCKEVSLPATTKFYASAFMLEEAFADTLPYPFDGIQGTVAWYRDVQHEQNAVFKSAMQQYDKEANVFSLLAWEAALLILQMKDAAAAAKSSLSKALLHFQPQPIASPRGELTLHAASRVFFGPAYLVELVKHEETGNSKLAFLKELSYDTERFVEEVPEGAYSKWTNTYLCI